MDDNIGYVLKKLEDMGQLVVDEGVKSWPGAVREIWPPPVEKKLRNDVRLIANSIIGVALWPLQPQRHSALAVTANSTLLVLRRIKRCFRSCLLRKY
jgi:hypothetical protein